MADTKQKERPGRSFFYADSVRNAANESVEAVFCLVLQMLLIADLVAVAAEDPDDVRAFKKLARAGAGKK